MGLNLMGAGLWAKKAQEISLPTGGLYTIPQGQYIVNLGQYSFVQYFDYVSNMWRNLYSPVAGQSAQLVTSDGYSLRLANLTGTPDAYRPPGSLMRGGHRQEAAGDYEPWKPE